MFQVVGTHSDAALLQPLFDLTPDPVWFVSQDGTVTRHNAAFARWQTVATGIRPTLEEMRKRAGERSVMADVHVIIAGVERTFSVSAQRVSNEGVLFVARDLGLRFGFPADVAIERALLNLFTSEEPLANILPQVLQFLCATDSWDAGIVWLHDDADKLRPVASWFGIEDAGFQERLPSMRFTAGHGVPGRALATREVVWIADILDESVMRRVELSVAAGVHSVVAVPMIDSDQIIGVLELFTRAERPINDAKVEQLRRTGEALGRLVARHKGDEERRRLLMLIERKGAEWMATFDSIHLPIFLATCDGIVARLNRSAGELAGTGFDDLVGSHFRVLGDCEPWKTLSDITTAVRDSRMPCTAQIAGADQTWDVSASLLEAQVPDEERVIIVLHETTQLMKLQDDVRRGEQLSALGELVAGVAHEVKNPIFGLGMTLDLFEQTLKDPESAELIWAMRKWVSRLSSLTENLLEYGKTWTVDLQPGSIDDVVQQAAELCRAQAAESGVTIECTGESKTAIVLMDAGRLAHVFENLMMNAIQFSPRDARVEVSINHDDHAVTVAVRDHGAGFNPKDFPRLCQPFFTRRRGGTGLGLAIVQRIVDEHGGTLNAANHQSGGAVIWVRFPRYRAENATTPVR